MEAIKGRAAPLLGSFQGTEKVICRKEARRLGISDACGHRVASFANHGTQATNRTRCGFPAVSPPIPIPLHTTVVSRAGVLPKGRALVPGCGRGYDSIAFGKSGYDSVGLDLSPTGVEQAKALLAEEKEEDITGKARQAGLSKHLSVVSRGGISFSCVRLKRSRDTQVLVLDAKTFASSHKTPRIAHGSSYVLCVTARRWSAANPLMANQGSTPAIFGA